MKPIQALCLLYAATLAHTCHSAKNEVLDELGRLILPPGMVRLGSSCGMKHGGYYDKYFTVHEVSTNIFAATPDWAPANLVPIPLPVHKAYDIYLQWLTNNTPTEVHDMLCDRIELTCTRINEEDYYSARR